jgi:hypothetical protein
MAIKSFSSKALVPLFTALLLIQISLLQAHAAEGLNINPFSLERSRLAPGTTFEVRIDKVLLTESKIVDDAEFHKFPAQVQGVSLQYEIVEGEVSRTAKIPTLTHYLTQRNHDLFLAVQMPAWQVLTRHGNDIRRQSPWRGWLKAYRAELTLAHPELRDLPSLPVEIPDPRWGFIWGLLVVFLSFVIVWALKPFPLKNHGEFKEDRSLENWEKSSRIRRFFLYPLNFAVTPIGTYSISLTQVLLWTYVTIFGLVYVHWLTGCFIEITEQVLMLLGIGGGTALAAKMNAVSRVREVPAKYMNLVKRERTPKLKDLVTIDGQPNIHKFQMLAFTVLIAYIVVVGILKSYAFPEIPNSLVVLMGISGGVYLSNEVTIANIWDEIKAKVDAIEKFARDNGKPVTNAEEIAALGIPEVNELINLLQGIYS